jgi:hypothetical protein
MRVMTTTIMTARQLIADQKAIEATQTYGGYTVAELRTTFEAIHNPTNWKLELAGIIPLADLPKATVAAEFFAGSKLTLAYSEPDHFGPARKCLVKGPGYYACVGA